MTPQDVQPTWYKNLVTWMFAGLGSTIGFALMTLFWHEQRITKLETSSEVVVEIKSELKTISGTLGDLQRQIDRRFAEAESR